MININIPKSELQATQLVLLRNFENDLTDYARRLLNTSEYNHILLQILIDINPRKTEKIVEYVSDASFNIKNSLSFSEKLKDFVEKSEELEVILPKHSIEISCHFSKKEFKSNENVGSSEKSLPNDLPAFSPTKPKYTFDQMILPEKIRIEIDEALRVIENREQVYEIWGFEEVEPTPKSILNFYGPPGTGKTMCAHAIANKLGKDLLALNYSEIESKYVGDAPKNLAHAFDVAQKLDAVMFFDEADSFLGKRIENVSQGSEQALNSLRSQMLIKLEEHSGIVLFATNLVTNFDHAFESRILKHIEFELPNKEARAEIIKKMIPSRLPLEKPISDDEYLDASELIEGFSGREIKSGILEMLLSKAGVANDHQFSIEDIKNSLKNKKDSMDKLKDQETQRLKEKIMKSANEQAEIAHAKNEELKKLENSKRSCFCDGSLISEEEQEYLDSVKEILEDYGEIGSCERKRLERNRVRLNISEERVQELEADVFRNFLTESEQEYLDEYKEMLVDYEVIGVRERKYLEKTCERLGISEVRAKELESLYKGQ